MAKPKKEVAVKKVTAIALSNQFEEYANMGFEEADRDAYAIPFLAILQSGSPQAKKSEGEYIEGAMEGMLYNSVSNAVYDPEKIDCLLIPCHYSRAFVEWRERGAGGGFVAQHGVEDGIELLAQTTKNDKNQDILPNGNLLVDTRSHYCLFSGNGGESWEPVVISMSSTQMKKSRKWMTVMSNLRMSRADGSTFNPPMFSHIYRLETIPESNDKGSWMGWKIETDQVVSDASLFEQAKAFRDAIVSGAAKAQQPADDIVVEREAF